MAIREHTHRDDMTMDDMAREIERHHEEPAPGAADLLPNPFPSTVLRGLWIGAIAGAIVGLIVGALLYNGIVVVGGWEQLYSVGDVSFYTFWAGIGVAFGLVIVGIGSLIAAPAYHPDAESGQPHSDQPKEHHPEDDNTPGDEPESSDGSDGDQA